MNEKIVGAYWNDNAEAWTALARAGYDLSRNHFNTPAFLKILPDINGRKGIDIGCGEGYNTRLLAQIGASLTAVDISEKFIDKAKELQGELADNIDYSIASATSLPFPDHAFDFATSFMCFMDIPDPEQALREAYRVIKPGGFLQFSITHPCFDTPHRKKVRAADGSTYAVEVGGYFNFKNGEIAEWIFSAAPPLLKNQFPKFKVPVFNRTLTFWMNAIIDAGFLIEKVNEPYPDDNIVKLHPTLSVAQIVAYFLHFRCRKPSIKNTDKEI